ncbi:Butyrophilin-like protein 1 [Vulpes lagopus]
MCIHKVQAFDNGLYTCLFRKGNFYEEANLELMVAGVGSAPQVHIQGPEEDGIRVMCMASGWFPKPQVQWQALSGEKFLTFSETYAQDAEGLYSVEAALVVRDSSSGNVTCSVLNPILGQEKVMAIFIPEPFFPQTSPWKPAFMVTLTVLTLLIFGAAYYTKREHTAKQQERQEWEKLHRDKEEDQQTKEKVLKDRGELQADLNWRKSVYLSAWRKAQLYADWRKKMFQALSVTLDPESAHPNLAVSDEKTSVTWKDTLDLGLGVVPKALGRWRALSGEKFLTFSETYAQDAEGLYSVEAALVVRDSSSGNVTCSVLNAILGQEKVMAIFIPEPFFPQNSPWKPAFMVTLTVLTLLIFGAAYYTKREHTAKQQERQEWEKLHRDKEEDQQTKEKVLKDRDEFQADIDWRKSVYLSGK